MLEEYAREYYNADNLTNSFYDSMNLCIARAEAQLGRLNPDRRFHDEYISGIKISVDSKNMCCKVELSIYGYEDKKTTMVFHKVKGLKFEGEIINEKSVYPPFGSLTTIAQILDVWYDYRTYFECCFLLDNARYFVIKAEDIQFITS